MLLYALFFLGFDADSIFSIVLEMRKDASMWSAWHVSGLASCDSPLLFKLFLNTFIQRQIVFNSFLFISQFEPYCFY